MYQYCFVNYNKVTIGMRKCLQLRKLLESPLRNICSIFQETQDYFKKGLLVFKMSSRTETFKQKSRYSDVLFILSLGIKCVQEQHLLQRSGPGLKVKTIGLVFVGSGKHFKFLYSLNFFFIE